MDKEEAIDAINNWLEENEQEKKVNYRLRDCYSLDNVTGASLFL